MSIQKKLALVLGAAILAAVGLCIHWRVPQMLQTYRLLSRVWDSSSQCFDMELYLDSGTLSLSGQCGWVTEDSRRVGFVCVGEETVYLTGGRLYFSNGNAYTLSDDATPEMPGLLPFLTGAAVSADGDGFSYAADGSSFHLKLDGDGSSLTGLSLSAELALNGEAMVCVADLRTSDETPAPIPDAVAQAMTAPAGDAEPLTTSLLRLWTALAELGQQEVLGFEVQWNAGSTSLGLGDRFTVYKRGDSYAIGKERFVHFQADQPQTDQQAMVTALPPILFLALENGNIEYNSTADTGTYTVELEQEQMRQIFQALAPEQEFQLLEFTGGSMSLTVRQGRLTGCQVSCSGSIRLLIAQLPLNLSLDAQRIDRPVFPE